MQSITGSASAGLSPEPTMQGASVLAEQEFRKRYPAIHDHLSRFKQRTPRQILSAWEHGRFTLLSSEGIITEIAEKLSHPKIGGSYGVTEEDIDWVRGLLLTQAEVIIVPSGRSW